MIRIDADTRALTAALARVVRQSPDILRRATNATAFKIREETPDIVDREVDRPRPQTRNRRSYVVDTATGRGLEATLRAVPAVNAFLRNAQFGLDDEYNNRPVLPTSRDRFGNIGRRFFYKPGGPTFTATIVDKRTKGASRRVGRFFYKQLDNSNAVGLFERYAQNKRRRLVAIQEFGRRNRKSINIVEAWQRVGRAELVRQVEFWAGRFLRDPSGSGRGPR